MPLIAQNIIDQVIRDSDIVGVVSEFVPLKKLGSHFKACCPFHQEKTPSFVVSPDKQIYHCFGCGAGGNVIGFLMNYEKLDFPGAVEKLADRLNIKIEHREAGPKENERDQLYKVNSYAKWFFCEHFKESEKAISYTKKRGLTQNTIAQFELGYAPESFEKLLKFLESKKVPAKLPLELGLIKRNDAGRVYDFYRDRLIFPIHNAKGLVVGFGGRTLSDKDEAKYINSAESPIYNKSRELYGLFQAKQEITKQNLAIIVEGYIDALACVQLGLKNTVAPLGTSLTAEQVKSLKRYTQNIVIMLDGDSAGIKAAVKAIETCFAALVHPKIVILADGKDPGDFLQNPSGATALHDLVAKAPAAMEWLFSESYKKATERAADRPKILHALTRWIKALPDEFEKLEFRNKLAQYFEIESRDIEKIVDITYESAIQRPLKMAPLSIEERLVYHLMSDQRGPLFDQLTESLKDIDGEMLKSVAEAVTVYRKKHETFVLSQTMQEMSIEQQGILSEIQMRAVQNPLESDLESCLKIFQQKRNKNRLKEITAQILQAETSGDTSLKLKLLAEKQKLFVK